MGPYKSNPNVFFLLADFREAGQQLPDPTRLTARLAELHKNSKSPTGKFGFHMRTLVGPIVQHNNGWSDSCEEIFSNLLGNLLDLDVIPRLLHPLQSGTRRIKPCLVHENLWDGNTATDMKMGEPFVFDGISFNAHNEYETGNWIPPRHRLSIVEHKSVPISEYPRF